MERNIKPDSDLVKALVMVQEELITIPMESDNPFFNSKYLGLASILERAKPLLTANGIAFIQSTDMLEGNLSVITELAHENGEEYIRSTMELPIVSLKDTKNFMQAIGSAITYMRRYQTMCILGLVGDDDDDANQLNDVKPSQKKKPEVSTKVKMEEGRRNITQLLEDNEDVIIGPFKSAMIDNADSAKTPEDLRETWKLIKAEITKIRKLEQKDREAQAKAEINATPGGGELVNEMLEKAGVKKGVEEPEEAPKEEKSGDQLDIF